MWFLTFFCLKNVLLHNCRKKNRKKHDDQGKNDGHEDGEEEKA